MLRKDVNKNPITLLGETQTETVMFKYLGDYVSFSLEESVHQTIVKRTNVTKVTIYEIRSVIEDARAKKVGSLNLAYDIWDQAIVPMLLYNSETWVDVSGKSLKLLGNLFIFFCRTIIRISVSCPIPSFYIERSIPKI